MDKRAAVVVAEGAGVAKLVRRKVGEGGGVAGLRRREEELGVRSRRRVRRRIDLHLHLPRLRRRLWRWSGLLIMGLWTFLMGFFLACGSLFLIGLIVLLMGFYLDNGLYRFLN